MMSIEDLVGKARLGQYLIFVTSEDADIDVNIPTHKVEKGIDITDHVERKAKVVNLKGLLIRPTPDRLERLVKALEDYETKGEILSYEGRRIYKNMLMSKFKIGATNKVTNGYSFSCRLTEADFGESSYIQPAPITAVKGVTSNGQVQSVNRNDDAVYHIVKRGDTYWGISKKYGSSIQQLRNWNIFPDTKIPIGAKLRVK